MLCLFLFLTIANLLVNPQCMEMRSSNSCIATDARGSKWTSLVNDKQTKKCSEIDSLLTGEAEWFCISSETNAYFNSTEPDRSRCQSTFLDGQISLEAVLNYTSSLNRDLTGGEVDQIVTRIEEVVTKNK